MKLLFLVLSLFALLAQADFDFEKFGVKKIKANKLARVCANSESLAKNTLSMARLLIRVEKRLSDINSTTVVAEQQLTPLARAGILAQEEAAHRAKLMLSCLNENATNSTIAEIDSVRSEPIYFYPVNETRRIVGWQSEISCRFRTESARAGQFLATCSSLVNAQIDSFTNIAKERDLERSIQRAILKAGERALERARVLGPTVYMSNSTQVRFTEVTTSYNVGATPAPQLQQEMVFAAQAPSPMGFRGGFASLPLASGASLASASVCLVVEFR